MINLRKRLVVTYLLFGGGALLVCVVAPLVGPTPINLRRAFDGSIPFANNVDAQIFFIARLPRAIAGALVGSALATSGVRFSGAAEQSTGHTVHTWGIGGRISRCHAGHYVRHALLTPRPSGGSSRQPRRIAGCRGDRVRVGHVSTTRPVDERAAACRRHGSTPCSPPSSCSCST